jgi:hypothetical protein
MGFVVKVQASSFTYIAGNDGNAVPRAHDPDGLFIYRPYAMFISHVPSSRSMHRDGSQTNLIVIGSDRRRRHLRRWKPRRLLQGAVAEGENARRESDRLRVERDEAPDQLTDITPIVHDGREA